MMPFRAVFAPVKSAVLGLSVATVAGAERWWFAPGLCLASLLFFQTVEFCSYTVLRRMEIKRWAYERRHAAAEGTESEATLSALVVRKEDADRYDSELTWRIGSKFMTWMMWFAALGLDGLIHFAPHLIPTVDFPFLTKSEFLPLTITLTLWLIVKEWGRIADNAERYQGSGGDAAPFRVLLRMLPWSTIPPVRPRRPARTPTRRQPPPEGSAE